MIKSKYIQFCNPQSQVVKEKKKGKDAGPKTFKTVSSAFRAQLDALLTVSSKLIFSTKEGCLFVFF